jgi:hypothetical protein
MKRGRKPGSEGPQYRSRMWVIEAMEVGDVCYFPTTLDRYQADQRYLNPARSRRPSWMADRVLTCSLFTAVSAGKAGDVRYLIAVERVA